MPRSRVLSFMSQWAPNSGSSSAPASPTTATSPKNDFNTHITPSSSAHNLDQLVRASPTPPPRTRTERSASRPVSMIQTYQPPLMEVAQDTLPELQPIFTYLNSHSNKLYQEGYFLKLHDLDARGRPSPDRVWVECFAQLVGTILSIWDAALLDQAGEDGEVVPTFINLTDASIKMIESLPMNGPDGQSLQNVLSISTAANNRYLLHFNSYNSLTQWTAGIRLAMFEHSTLQEAYTGSLIAGKGRFLNNIRAIMERSKFKTEDWARVRFGAGTPWRRCWCVVTPPDEKEWQKATKTIKKRSSYEREIVFPKGDIKFYETKNIKKKTKPIAAITNAYAAYAIYPQSKPLIDQSTLMKIEGQITIHGDAPVTTEGFVFIMPEVHAMVSGFEMMLRFLFPIFDTFAIYGRPNKLIADVLDPRGLMFAMPNNRRYGYLDILDVAGLISESGSQGWSEREWRKQLKELTARRMTSGVSDNGPLGSRRNTVSRTSLPPSRERSLKFDDAGSVRSQPPTRRGSPAPDASPFGSPKRVGTAPPAAFGSPRHTRSTSEKIPGVAGYKNYQPERPSRMSYELDHRDDSPPPPPPAHGVPIHYEKDGVIQEHTAYTGNVSDRESPDADTPTRPEYMPEMEKLRLGSPPPVPVGQPPAFVHSPGSRPSTQPYQAPEIRRANSQFDEATMQELRDSNQAPVQPSVGPAGAAAAAAWRTNGDDMRNGMHMQQMRSPQGYHGQTSQRGVYPDADNDAGSFTDSSALDQGVVNPRNDQHRIPRRQLPTIPASPFVPQEPQHEESPSSYFAPTAVPVSEEPPTTEPQPSTTPDRPDPPSRTQTSNNIPRKPVPAVPASVSSDDQPRDLSDLRSHAVDPEALDRVLSNGSIKASSSVYDDSISDVTPDYASTKSAETRRSEKSVEKPRMGVLRTVGNDDVPPIPVVVGDTVYEPQKKDSIGADIPAVDFGPTKALTPGSDSRPGTSGTITGLAERNKSAERLSGNATPQPRISPGDGSRESYFGGRESPAFRSHSRLGSDPAGGPAETPGNRRSMVWQPGMVSGPGTQQQRSSITPEQWVQQRASLSPNNSPIRSHGRNTSGTPPTSRHSSGDWTQLRDQQARTPSREMPSRPHSRGASMLMQPNQGLIHQTQDHARGLSAREQEYIAKATGSPLIQVARNDRRRESHDASGLLGAIAAREQEKQDIKQGQRSALVQDAINANIQRQQQEAMQRAYNQQAQMQAQAQAQMQRQMEMQQMQMQQMQAQHMQMTNQFMYGQQAYPMQTTPGSVYGMQQQTPPPIQDPYAFHPAAQAYAAGGGWSTPSRLSMAYTPQGHNAGGYFSNGQQGQGQFQPGQQQQQR